MNADPYQVLGVPRNASDEEIKSAYRKLARETHPDTNPGDKEAEERFKEISSAYEILSNPEKKFKLDNPNPFERAGFGVFAHGFPFGNPFARFDPSDRGPKNPIPPPGSFRGKNCELGIDVDVVDLLVDNNIQIKYPRKAQCKECGGRGSDLAYCPTCEGYGFIRKVHTGGHQTRIEDTQCDHCMTRGLIRENSCKACDGNGIIEVEEEVTVALVSNIQVLKGYGDFGPFQGSPGDLVLRVRLSFPNASAIPEEAREHLRKAAELIRQ